MNFKTKTPSILKAEQVIENSSMTLSTFFREKGEVLQETIGEGFSTLYPQEKVASKLNISVDQLRQKIYGKKPLTRDWLIAICAAYGLDDFDTSDALSICNMPTLDDASKREAFFVSFLRKHKNKPVSVNEFNAALEAAKLPCLNISYRKKKTQAGQKNIVDSLYKKIRPCTVRSYGYEGDPYNSLLTEYDPNIRCVATTFLESSDHKKYLLEAYSDGKFLVYSEGNALPEILNDIDVSNEFYPFFSELSILVEKQKQKLDDVLNDTKNYHHRFSANIKNDRIHIFYEEFNYSIPERNEYYLMEYVDGYYKLSISNKSMFMQEYLSPDAYYLHYHTYEKIPRKTYTCIEDINNSKTDTFYPFLQQNRISAFIRLQHIVSEKLQEIRDRKVYIQNLDYIWDNPYNVLKYYGIEKLFSCTFDDDYGEITEANGAVQFTDETGSSVNITFEDVCFGFKMGLSSFNDICRIKRKYGDLTFILD